MYGPTPPDTVKSPLLSSQIVMDWQELTTMLIVSEPQGKVYVIECVPTPAIAGLKTPDEETPGPLHVPPAVAVTRVNDGSFAQNVVG